MRSLCAFIVYKNVPTIFTYLHSTSLHSTYNNIVAFNELATKKMFCLIINNVIVQKNRIQFVTPHNK